MTMSSHLAIEVYAEVQAARGVSARHLPTKRRTRRRQDSAAVAAGTTKPSNQNATWVSTRSTIHPKFMPKNPVMKVSGTKIVATTLTR